MASARPLSFWLATAPAFDRAAAGDVAGRADVAVIGGGFTGLSAALALGRQGADVVVLDAGRVIGEASGRNGGQCNNGLAHDYGALSAKIGKARAQAYYRAHCDAVDSVERIVREEAIDCAFARVGRIKLAAKPAHYDAMVRAHDLLIAEVDPTVQLVPPDRIGDEIGSDGFHGGLIQPRSAQLHVGRFGIGLAKTAAAKGARIFENATVTGLERLPNGWRLTTPRGTMEAAQVLVATGGASAEKPFGWFRRRMVSVGSFVIATAPIDPALIDRLMPRRRNYVTSRIIGNYFRLTDDNRLIFGGRARFAVSNPESDAIGGKVLEAKMAEFFPALKGIGIDHVWGGMIDLTADRLPRAGEHDGLFHAMGYSGHGVQMSVHMGHAMADVMMGRPQANPWADLGWPAIPGHLGKPWFLPFVGAYYRVQDALH